jgi:uncharacterized CHY-type Zn-finger protein
VRIDIIHSSNGKNRRLKEREAVKVNDCKYALEIMNQELSNKFISPEITYAFVTCIETLEKQIPKPIVGIKAQLQNRYCPSCNEWMFFDKYGQAKYCPTCGQAIDWRSEDE